MSRNMNYDDTELEVLLDELKSDLAERMESWAGDAPEKGRQAVCAFANDLPDHRKPGVLFVGVKDNGTPSGLEITDNLLMTLADIKTDGNIPGCSEGNGRSGRCFGGYGVVSQRFMR